MIWRLVLQIYAFISLLSLALKLELEICGCEVTAQYSVVNISIYPSTLRGVPNLNWDFSQVRHIF